MILFLNYLVNLSCFIFGGLFLSNFSFEAHIFLDYYKDSLHLTEEILLNIKIRNATRISSYIKNIKTILTFMMEFPLLMFF